MRLDDYVELFGLTTAELRTHILEYAYGAEMLEIKIEGILKPVTLCPSKPDGILPFADFAFDLALCQGYLFSDEVSHDVDFHLQQIMELARVAKDVRIFPLSHQGVPSPILGPVLLGLQQENYGVEIRDVTSSDEQRGNAMLRVWAQLCRVS